MIFINILMFFQSDSTLFSVTHQGVLYVNQQIPTLKFYFESRITKKNTFKNVDNTDGVHTPGYDPHTP